jgi:aryl-alcohol dehydrogenase-like predicted oxidoreductase
VNRLRYGAMRITGPGVWGEPPDLDRAKAPLHRPYPKVPVGESIGALAELQDEGEAVLAWLLARSSRTLPIPGSGSPGHMAENVAAGLELSPDEVTAITKNA